MNSRILPVVLAGLLAAACAGSPPATENQNGAQGDAEAGAPSVPTFHAYDCESGRRLISKVQGDSMELFLVTERVQLERQPSE